MKWRDVVAEENIDRRNYRNSDYRDEGDGDFESSIYYGGQVQDELQRSDRRKNDINQGVRDESLVMYQNDHEQYDLNGGSNLMLMQKQHGLLRSSLTTLVYTKEDRGETEHTGLLVQTEDS